MGSLHFLCRRSWTRSDEKIRHDEEGLIQPEVIVKNTRSLRIRVHVYFKSIVGYLRSQRLDLNCTIYARMKMSTCSCSTFLFLDFQLRTLADHIFQHIFSPSHCLLRFVAAFAPSVSNALCRTCGPATSGKSVATSSTHAAGCLCPGCASAAHPSTCGCAACTASHSATCTCAACSSTSLKMSSHGEDCGCSACSASTHGAFCTCSACSASAHPANCACAACAPSAHAAGCACATCAGVSQ